MQFVLVGPHQGKNIVLAGFVFRNGVTEVPDEAKDAHNLLTNFNSAHPAHLIRKGEDGKLTVMEKEDVKRLDFIPTPLPAGPTGAVPVPGAPVPVDLDGMRKDDLVAMASKMNLASDGNKADLIQRIRAAQDQE